MIITARPKCLSQLIEQGLSLFQIGSVKSLGEPVVDRCEKVAGFFQFTLLSPQPDETRRSAEFERLRTLIVGNPIVNGVKPPSSSRAV